MDPDPALGAIFAVGEQRLIGKRRIQLLGSEHLHPRTCRASGNGRRRTRPGRSSSSMRSESTTASPRLRREPKKARKQAESDVAPPVSPASRNRNARKIWFPSPFRRHPPVDLPSVPDDRNEIVIHQADVGQRPGHLAGEVELGRAPERHGSAAVHEQVDRQVGLLIEDPQYQLVEPEERLPVHVARVVPVHGRAGSRRVRCRSRASGRGVHPGAGSGASGWP